MPSGRNRPVISAFRIAIGLLALVAVAIQFSAAMNGPTFNPTNFFGFFTILSNIFGAIVLLYASVVTKLPSRNLDVLRGAAVLCITIVGAVYSLLLTNVESDVIPWVNIVAHYIVPAAIVLDWLIDPPQAPLTIRDGLLWLTLPIAYLSYTLLRGSIVHWYPYPFLNVDTNGYASVLTYSCIIFVASLVVAIVVVVVGNALRLRRKGRLNRS